MAHLVPVPGSAHRIRAGPDSLLANLLVSTKGQVSINPSRLSKLEVRISLPNLQGWPQLVPLLGSVDPGTVINAGQLNQANGSMTVAATVELPLADPGRLKSDTRIELEALEARDLVSPFSFKKDIDTPQRKQVEGVLRGAVQASGSFSAKNWKVRRAVGTMDLKDVKIEWSDLLNKPRGKDLLTKFDSAADGTKIKIEKMDLKTDISSVSIKGSVTISGPESAPEYKIDSSLESQVVLSQIYDLAPFLRSMRSKVPSGSVFNSYKVSGIFKPKEGLEKSPLVLDGKTVLRAPQAVYLESKEIPTPTTKGEQKPSSPKFDFLKWPVLANSKIVFDGQIDKL